MKQVTIKDIAKELNLSISTVSRALRDSWEISEPTKQRVLELAKRLEYNPNPAALNLLNSHSKEIGVIVPEIANPFFAVVIAGIEDIAFAQGYQVVIYQSHDSYEREVLNVKHILQQRKDGLLVSIATSTKDVSHFQTMRERGFPIVFFDRVCEGIDTHSVSVDDFEGAYMATEHLLNQGCEQLALLSGPEHLLTSRRRIDGYRTALLDHNRPVREEWIIPLPFNPEQSLAVTRELLSSPDRPDGIFAASDAIALGSHAAINELGLSMPEEIALIGFADLPIASLLNPPLSSVAEPTFEMGQSAAKLLINLIQNPDEQITSINKVLKTKLMVRRSSQRAISRMDH